MRRYEFVEGTSKKFWEISLDGESFTTRWGRLGTEGQSRTQTFGSSAEARKAHDSLIAEKEKKGYQQVGGEVSAARSLPAKVPSDPGIEEAVARDPEARKPWMDYGAFLVSQGEPWGEVILAACEGKPDIKRQKAATEALLGGVEAAEGSWVHGVISEFNFQPSEYDEENPMPAVLERLLKHPAGHGVRKLTLGLPPCEDGEIEWHMEPLAQAISRAGPLPFLETLDLSPDAEHMDQPSWRRVGDIRGIWKAAPRLKALYLQGASGSDDGVKVRLAPIDAPCLETLVFKSGGLDAAAPKEIGAAVFPRLTHLELWFGVEDYGCTSTVASLAKILEGKGLPALKRLGLMNSEWEEKLIQAVAESAILPRLEVVDFSMGILCQAAAQALLKHAGKYQHLKTLILDDNFFLKEDIKALKKVLPCARFGTQKEPEGELEDRFSRYTTVAE